MSTVIKLSDITLPGSGYPKLSLFKGVPELPEATGLIGLYLLKGTALNSLINEANDAAPLTVIGAPTVNSFGALLSKSHCFDTGLMSTTNMTFMAVAKPMLVSDSDNGNLIVSNYGATPAGDSMGFAAVNSLAAYAGLTSSVSASTIGVGAADVADWNFVAGVIDANGGSKCHWGRDGVLSASTLADSGTRQVNTTRTLRLGSNYSSGFNGTANVALVAIFSAALNDAQIAANYNYLKATWAPIFGITTL